MLHKRSAETRLRSCSSSWEDMFFAMYDESLRNEYANMKGKRDVIFDVPLIGFPSQGDEQIFFFRLKEVMNDAISKDETRTSTSGYIDMQLQDSAITFEMINIPNNVAAITPDGTLRLAYERMKWAEAAKRLSSFKPLSSKPEIVPMGEFTQKIVDSRNQETEVSLGL